MSVTKILRWRYRDVINRCSQNRRACVRKIAAELVGGNFEAPARARRAAGRAETDDAGFFKACEEMEHQVVEDVGAPIRDGAGYVDFNTKDGQRFSVVHGYLLHAQLNRSSHGSSCDRSPPPIPRVSGHRAASINRHRIVPISSSNCSGDRLSSRRLRVVSHRPRRACRGNHRIGASPPRKEEAS